MLEVERSTADPRVVEGLTAASPLRPFVPALVRRWETCYAGRTWAQVDGTLVSADISGFTNLSERLAHLGREGAEELTSLVNGRFTAMIDVAAGAGGDVLKFGGDALLLLFTGHDHAVRAAAASLGMRATVDAPLASAFAGRVRLRMSVGLHAGTFCCFLVDGGHRELLVTGADVTATVRCEDQARAGDVLASHAAADLLPPRWLGGRHDLGRLVRRQADPLEILDVADDDGLVTDLSPFVPTAQQAAIATDAVGEHRQVTTAFVKFSGTDGLIEAHGPETLAQHLQDLAATVAEEAARHEVHWLASDVYPDGGKIILTAGAPTTVEDDEERLLRTVRSVLDRVEHLTLRAGVHAGPVFAGLVGSPRRRTFTVMGDAVNLAARLMQRAEPGQVIASVATLERSAAAFATTPIEPFLVKGKTQPVHAAVVGAIVADDRAVADDAELPFVGRAHELAVVREAVNAVREGAGRVLDVVGEAGVGKSRLLEEAQRLYEELPTVLVRCRPYGRVTPYDAIRPLLRRLAGIADDEPPEPAGRQLEAWVAATAPDQLPWLPFVAMLADASVAATPEAERIAPAFRRPTIHRAVGAVLAAALQEPRLLVVEDAHHIDDASEALLREVLPLVERTPVLVWISRRPTGGSGTPWAPSGLGTVVELGALPPSESERLVEALAGAFDPEMLARLVERSGGNPLFFRELLAVVRAAGAVDELPESLERLITARIDTLAPEDRVLLRDAAVMGSIVELDVLAAVRPAARDLARWSQLHDFVQPDRRTRSVRFRHALYQQAAYEGLSYQRRRHVHRVVGEALEERYADTVDELAPLLSLHFSRGRSHRRAWEYSTLAGDQARAKHAPNEAAALYARALESAGAAAVPDAEVGRVSEALGDVNEVAARYDAAASAYRAARRVSQGRAHIARLLRKEGVLRERAGRYTQALQWYGRGLTALARPDGDTPPDAPWARRERAELRLAYAGVRYRQGRYHDCVRWAHQVAAAIEDDADRDDRLLAALAHAYYLLDLGYTYLGSGERAAYRGRALPLYEQLDDLLGQANVLNNLGIAAFQEGDWAEALRLYERARAASERVGDVVGMAMGTNNIGEILSDQGHLEEATELLREALTVWRRASYPVGVAEATSNLGRAEARAGRTDVGLSLLGESRAWFESMDATGLALRDGVRHAECRLLAGDVIGARQELDELRQRFDAAGGEPGDHAALERLVAVAALAAEDADAARRAIDAAVDLANASGAAYELGHALLVRAGLRAGGGEDGTEDRRRGQQILDDLGVVCTWLIPDRLTPDS